MKWNVYIYNPKTEQTVTKVMEYPGTHKSDGAAVVVYAARDLKVQQKYILALPKTDGPKATKEADLNRWGDWTVTDSDAMRMERAGRTSEPFVLDDKQPIYGLRIVASDKAGYGPGKHVVQYKDRNGMWFDIGDPKTKERAEAAKTAESHRLVTSKSKRR